MSCAPDLTSATFRRPRSASARRRALEVLSQPIANLPDSSDVAAARKQLLDFLRREVSDDNLQRRLHEKALAACITVDFLIAGIADYVDSNVGWYADLDLEAIQAAMVTAGYTFDRFYLPDWPRNGHAAHMHRESPGAVVFRGRTPSGQGTLRVVLLVPETPTAGLHREALRNALTLVRTWDTNPASEIRILGPHFSGSVDSLARVLREDRRSGTSARSASSAEPRRHPPTARCSKRAPRSSMAGAWSRSRPPRILFRSGSARSSAISARSIPLGRRATGWPCCTRAIPPSVPTSVKQGIFPDWTPIAFPLHISRLREAAAAAATTALRPGQTRALIPLSNREASTPTDQIPLLAPDLTGASVEATMASVFDALRRERFRVVAIIATDERDTLYLAREVRRISPDTQLVLFGSYMLAFHPEYAWSTRGAIVVSSYPLAAATAHWGVSASKSSRRTFPTWFAQGIYNAALALVGTPNLVDYAVPVAHKKATAASPTGAARLDQRDRPDGFRAAGGLPTRGRGTVPAPGDRARYLLSPRGPRPRCLYG